jgi:hypothetical protein
MRVRALRPMRPRDAEALVLAVHWLRIDDVLQQVGDSSRKILVQILELFAEDGWRRVHARELDVRPPGTPTTRPPIGALRRAVNPSRRIG